MRATLELLRERGAVSSFDASFARALARIGGDDRPEILMAAALVSRQVAQGDVCLDLPSWLASNAADEDSSVTETPLEWPPVEDWLEGLRQSALVSTGRGDAPAPLVLDAAGRLYLQRLHTDEDVAATAFLQLAGSARSGSGLDGEDEAALSESIDRLLPAGGPGADGPRQAARVAATRRLCVISGGPGTGKTTTAARLLAVLVEQALRAGKAAPRIALAAPTGKAAGRLAEAIAAARSQLDCSDAVRDAIPTVAKTLHRLLRVGFRRPAEARGEEAHRVVEDIVLVDEASMIDLALMSRLVSVLAPSTRLLLLGDPDQLASVEAGAVFADLCGVDLGLGSSPETASSVAPCVVRLTHSHRYANESGIGALAESIQRGDPDAALAVLDDPRFPDVLRMDPASEQTSLSLRERGLEGYADFARESDPASRLAALGRFRMLCAVREGPFGVRELNRQIDGALVDAGQLRPAPAGSPVALPGRPILVTRNAPQVGLFNGDVGVVGADASGAARAFFEAPGGAIHSFGISRLPSHEAVFAMTVHKSQGSEFDDVLLVLPDEPLPLLTRELVYTGVTRARSRVVVVASAAVLSEAIRRRVSRASGLRAALWPGSGERGTV